MNEIKMPQIDEKQSESMLSEVKWTFAKTYAKTAPHEYIVNHQYPSVFEQMCNSIDAEGYDQDFTLSGHTNRYRYYNLGGYKYWHFDTILNREPLNCGLMADGQRGF